MEASRPVESPVEVREASSLFCSASADQGPFSLPPGSSYGPGG